MGQRSAWPFERGEHQQLQRGVVVRADAAVDEGAFHVVGHPDLLGLEVGGRRRARPHHVAQQVVLVRRGIAARHSLEVAPPGIVVHDPRTAGVETLGHDGEPGLELRSAEPDVAVLAFQGLLHRLCRELGPQQALAKEARLEDRVPELAIELLDALHRPAERERGGDDGTGRGSADQIEVVGEHRLVVAGALADELLDPPQELHGENATDSAAVEGEDALRPGSEQVRVQVFLRHFIISLFCALCAVAYGIVPGLGPELNSTVLGQQKFAPLLALYLTGQCRC